MPSATGVLPRTGAPRHDDTRQAVGWVGRAGLAARGVLYVAIAVLAADVALGHTSRSADRRGALGAISSRPYGWALILVLAAGFAAMAVWQAFRAATGRDGGADGNTLGAPPRIAAAATTVVYAAFAASAVGFLRHRGQKNSDQSAQGWTATLMHHHGGRLVVGVAGLVLIGAGAVLLVLAVRRKADQGLRPGAPRAVIMLGSIGYAARALVVALAGGFLVDAAVTFDPAKAKGLDGALRALAHEPGGTAGLLVAAAGLGAFGVWSIVVARYIDAA